MYRVTNCIKQGSLLFAVTILGCFTPLTFTTATPNHFTNFVSTKNTVTPSAILLKQFAQHLLDPEDTLSLDIPRYNCTHPITPHATWSRNSLHAPEQRTPQQLQKQCVKINTLLEKLRAIRTGHVTLAQTNDIARVYGEHYGMLLGCILSQDDPNLGLDYLKQLLISQGAVSQKLTKYVINSLNQCFVETDKYKLTKQVLNGNAVLHCITLFNTWQHVQKTQPMTINTLHTTVNVLARCMPDIEVQGWHKISDILAGIRVKPINNITAAVMATYFTLLAYKYYDTGKDAIATYLINESRALTQKYSVYVLQKFLAQPSSNILHQMQAILNMKRHECKNGDLLVSEAITSVSHIT